MAQLQSTSITGSLIVTQGITAQSLNVQYITSSIVYSSGSNTFGDQTSDNQYFTGSILQSGSLAYFAGSVGIGITNPSEKLRVNGTFSSNALWTDSGAVSYWGNYSTAYGGLTWDTGYATVFATSGNRLNLGSNGSSPDMTIDTNGNVGIGITNPARLLDINGTTNFRDAYYFSNGGVGYTTWGTIDGASALNIQAASGYAINLGTNASTGRVVINTSGNVGIGSTSPSSKLEVYNASADTRVLVTTTGGNSYTPRISLDKRGDSAWNISSPAGGFNFLIDQDGISRFWIASSTGNIGIGTIVPIAKLHVSGSSGSLAFNVEGSQGQLFSVTDSLSGSLMSVNDISGLPILEVFSDDRVIAGKFGSNALSVSGSNVGIGAYNPARKLDVYDATAQIVAQFSSSNATSTRIKFSDANTGAENVNVGAIGTRFAVWTNNTERLSILSGGNVGIGSSSPGHALSVLGTVSASAFLGSVTNATSASFAESASNARSAITASSADTFYVRGSIGIGTTSPGYKLEVTGNGYFSSTLLANDDLGIGRTPAGNEQFTISVPLNQYAIAFYSGSSLNYGFHTNNGVFNFNGITGSTYNFQSVSVGIGTTVPSGKLHIKSSTTNSYPFLIQRAANTNNIFYVLESSLGDGVATIENSGGGATVQLHSNGVTYFTGGNVGIGTTSPTYKLFVSGGDTGNSFFVQGYVSGKAYGITDRFTLTTDTRLWFYDSNAEIYRDSSILRVYGNNGITLNFSASRGLTVGSTAASRGVLDVVTPSRDGYPGLVVSSSGWGAIGTPLAVFDGGPSGDGDVVKIKGLGGRSDADILEVVTSGGTALVVLGNGNVGIGSASPVTKFNVAGGRTYLQTGAEAYTLGISRTSANAYYLGVSNSSSPDLYFSNNAGTHRVAFTDSGNVGIGTTSPGYKLHISGGSEYIEGGFGSNAAVAYTATNRLIFNNDYSDVARGPNKITLYDASWLGGFGIHNDTLGYYSGGTHKWYQATSATNAVLLMSLNSSGNLGVGVLSPAYKLEVLGTVSASAYLGSVTSAVSASFAPNFANTNLSLNGDRTHNVNGNTLTFTATSDESIIFNHSSGGTFEINGSPTIQTTGVLQHQGSGYFTTNIGIGTTATTTARLHVSASTGNIIRATAAGSDILIVSSSGNVGIGLTSLSAYLDVKGLDDTAGVISLQLRSGNSAANFNSNQITLGYANTATYRHAIKTRHQSGGPSGNSIDFYTWQYGGASTAIGGQHVMSLDGANVGIGSTAPGYKLDVAGDINFSSILKFAGVNVIHNSSTDVYINGRVLYSNSTLNDGMYINYNSTSGTSAHLRFFANGTNERMRIDASTGNIGIGTNNPTGGRVHIDGSDPFLRVNNTSANNHGIKISYNYSDTHGLHLLYNANAATASIDNTYPVTSGQIFGDIYFRQNVSSAMTTRMMIKADGGNVGIGTVSPAAKLHVVGDIRASLSSNLTPNYVTYNTSTGLMGYAGTGSIVVGTATNADFIYVNTTTSNTDYSLALAVPVHDEYERLYADPTNATYNPSTGTLTVVTLNAQEKSFSIPHKELPGKKLVYGVLEGPEHSVYVRGKSSERVIELPQEWKWLVDEDSITVSLTPIGEPNAIYVEEIADNRIYVNSNAGTFKYFYYVYATRKDVEPLKTIQ